MSYNKRGKYKQEIVYVRKDENDEGLEPPPQNLPPKSEKRHRPPKKNNQKPKEEIEETKEPSLYYLYMK